MADQKKLYSNYFFLYRYCEWSILYYILYTVYLLLAHLVLCLNHFNMEMISMLCLLSRELT